MIMLKLLHFSKKNFFFFTKLKFIIFDLKKFENSSFLKNSLIIILIINIISHFFFISKVSKKFLSFIQKIIGSKQVSLKFSYSSISLSIYLSVYLSINSPIHSGQEVFVSVDIRHTHRKHREVFCFNSPLHPPSQAEERSTPCSLVGHSQ